MTRKEAIVSKRVPAYVFLGGVIAASIDLLSAFLFYGIRYGVRPIRICQSIATGLQGRAAMSGGTASAVLGLLLHFLIGITAASVYALAARRLPVLLRRPVPCGIVYGIAIYATMNFVIVPLSRSPQKLSTDPLVVGTGLLVHMFGIGLPIALAVRYASRHAEAEPTVRPIAG